MKEIDSYEELTRFLNRPKNQEWLEFCKSDLDFYYKIQFKAPYSVLKNSKTFLKELEFLFNTKGINKKKIYELIMFESMFGTKCLKQCREAIVFLAYNGYFDQKKTEKLEKEFRTIENQLLKFTKKFAKGGKTCQP